jgi:CTP:molybdopterin cytidylyltransferase MocA
VTHDAGLVLAAGEGRRFGGPKAPYVLAGERLVDRAARVLREAGCDPVVVVLGAWVGEVPGAAVVVNPDWPHGMGSSLRCGLAALAEIDPPVDRAVLTLVDLPGLTPAAVQRVRTAPGALVQATYDGRRGHPVILGREHWDGVVELAVGDRGARDYLSRDEVTRVEVGDVATGDDLDEPPRGSPAR